MKTLEKIILLLGIVVILSGYGINKFAQKYLTLYRSMQFRNIKIQETLNSIANPRIIMGVIAAIAIISLGYFLIKRFTEIKEKSVSILGVLVCSGQALKALSADPTVELGGYVLLFGYLIGLLGFIIQLFRREKAV